MPFLLEISIFLFFLLLVQFLINKKKANQKGSKKPTSQQIKKNQKQILSFVILSTISFILVHFLLYLFHRLAGFEYFLFVESISLILPALVLALLFFSIFNKPKNKEDEIKNGKAKNSSITYIIRIGFAFGIAGVLLFFNFNHYLRMDEESLYYKIGPEMQQIIPIKDISIIEESNNFHFSISTPNISITTDKFGGDISSFIKELEKKRSNFRK